MGGAKSPHAPFAIQGPGDGAGKPGKGHPYRGVGIRAQVDNGGEAQAMTFGGHLAFHVLAALRTVYVADADFHRIQILAEPAQVKKRLAFRMFA